MEEAESLIQVYWLHLGWFGFLTPPHFTGRKRKLHRIYCWISFASYVFLNFLMLLQIIVQGLDNFLTHMTNFSFFIATFNYLIKALPFYFRSTEMLNVISNIKDSYARVFEEGDSEKIKILVGKSKRIHRIFYMYTFYVASSSIFIYAFSFISMDHDDYRILYANVTPRYQRTDDFGMYLDLYTPFDLREKTAYVCNFLFFSILIFKFIALNPITNAFYWVTMMDHNRQLKLLCYNLENIKDESIKILELIKDKKDISENDVKREMFKNLNDNIKFHQKILYSTGTVTSLLIPYLTLNWIFLAVSFCLYMNQAAGVELTATDILTLYGTVAEQFDPVTYCVLSTQLIDMSQAVGDSVYFSKWFDGGRSFRTGVEVIIRRSQKYESIKGIFVGDISLALYSNILQTAYSYYTLLRSLQE